jgi:hypothetical protein
VISQPVSRMSAASRRRALRVVKALCNIVVGACLVGWLVGSSAAFKECIHTRKHEAAYSSLHKNSSIPIAVRTRLELHTVCVGDWADKYQGAIAAIATAIVAIFTFALWQSTHKLWRAGEKQSEIAASMSSAARLQADIMCKQLDIISIQKDISRLQFFADHRPKLIVRDVFFSKPGQFDVLIFELANAGGSVARIIGGFVAVNFVSDQRQFKSPDGGSLCSILQAEIKDGQLRPFSVAVPDDVQFRLRWPESSRLRSLDDTMPPAGDIYFFGILAYVDGRGEEYGTTRMSVFRRKWDKSEVAFCRTGGPDHEYAD